MTLTFTVDRPLSINRVYARGRGQRLYMTEDGVAFKERVRAYALSAKMTQGWPADLWTLTRVELSYTLEGYRGDTDGPRKVVRDALEGILYVNDRIVQDGPTPLAEPGASSKIHVTVRVLEVRSQVEATKARLKWEKARDARMRAKPKARKKAAA